MFKRIACIRIGGGEIVRDAAEETPVAVFVNGRHLTTVALSPGGFRDFIAGPLYRGISQDRSHGRQDRGRQQPLQRRPNFQPKYGRRSDSRLLPGILC